MTEAAHAFLAPSSAHRWGPGGCPGSPTMEVHYPEDEESPEAREGTAAHTAVTEPLSGRAVAVGDIAPNGIPIDADMIEAATAILRDVQDTVKAQKNGTLFVESRVYMRALVHEQNWGTPDIYFIDRFRRVLFLWDYKYGHRYVDAYRNWQCIDYAIGVFETQGVPLSEWGGWMIHITIAQPRNYHPDGPLREWHLSGAQLAEHRDQLRLAAEAACTPGAALVTGEHCRDCRARHACPALQRVAMAMADVSMQGQPIDLPPDALGLELLFIDAAMKRLSARREGLAEQALFLSKKGTSVPFWRGEYSYGRTRWNMTPQEVIALGKSLGIALEKPSTITPTQAIALGMDKELVKLFSETPRGAMTLVPFKETDVAKRFA